MAVTFFFLEYVLLLLLDSKPSFNHNCLMAFDIANFVLIFIILLSNQLRSPNSFIYYVDKGESQKDNVNVVPNFSYKKTETHHGSCFISAIE